MAKKHFADEIAGQFYKHANAGDLREITMITPPAILGDLRKKLHE